MCLEPVTLKDRTQVACRSCDLCRQNRVNDLIGRCVAEQSKASVSLAVTLTYAGDTPNSVVLAYRDIQLFLKRIRKAGYSVRYICAGEYGEAKSRAHWHIILFFYGDSPAIPLDRRVDWEYWPHGFSYFQNPDYKGFHYILKYALKRDPRQGASKSLAMSKKPPLGHDFFVYGLARDLVERGLPLHSPEYRFAHVLDRHGVPRRYWLQGRMRELFLEQYCGLWFLKYRTEPPMTEFLSERFLDKIAREEMDADPRLLDRNQAVRQAEYNSRQAASRSREFAEANAKIETEILVLNGTANYILLYADRTAAIYLEDERPWLVSAEANVAEQLQRSALPKSLVMQVCQYLENKWQLRLPVRKPS